MSSIFSTVFVDAANMIRLYLYAGLFAALVVRAKESALLLMTESAPFLHHSHAQGRCMGWYQTLLGNYCPESWTRAFQ